jgi:site-specific DNA-cytosine methylase
MHHISLFSGEGGFDLASEWMGWDNLSSCEINPFCNRILSYYWPDAYHHDDIKTLTYDKINEELTKRFGSHWRTDDIVLTGGFP